MQNRYCKLLNNQELHVIFLISQFQHRLIQIMRIKMLRFFIYVHVFTIAFSKYVIVCFLFVCLFVSFFLSLFLSFFLFFFLSFFLSFFLYLFVCTFVCLFCWYATLCDKVRQWLAIGQWFSPGTPASSSNKTDLHTIVEIMLNTIKRTNKQILIYLILLYIVLPDYMSCFFSLDV